LQGPKIRIGNFPAGPTEIFKDAKITITTNEAEPCTATRISTTYKELTHDVRSGDRILIDDGNIELRVIESRATEVDCVVVYGGVLSNHKGMNLPGVHTSIPSLTEKDKEDDFN
jgi:pyruvate kinase